MSNDFMMTRISSAMSLSSSRTRTRCTSRRVRATRAPHRPIAVAAAAAAANTLPPADERRIQTLSDTRSPPARRTSSAAAGPPFDKPRDDPSGLSPQAARLSPVDVRELRRMKDELFASSNDSPLTLEQRATFGGLRYFDPDPRYRFEVTLDRAEPGPPEEIQTNDGRVQRLGRAGTLRFEVDGRPASLVAYERGGELFIPFRDATSDGD